MALELIAPCVHRVNIFNFVNAFCIENGEGDWVLLDAGVSPALSILKGAEKQMGRPPVAILLTHGHFDHAGSAGALAREWKVKVFAGRLEKPYLTGQSSYPPPDPTVGGSLAMVARVLPSQAIDLSDVLEIFPENGKLDFLKGWRLIETPGHSPGHVALWHEDDRTLLAGDAFCTADMDSPIGMMTLKPTQFARGGSPFVPDWEAMKHSVGVLADLEPVTVGAGHGIPMSGGEVPGQLRDFYHNFTPPAHGRYVGTPAKTDESGVTFLPPAPPDPLPRNAAIGAAIGAATFAILGRTRKD